MSYFLPAILELAEFCDGSVFVGGLVGQGRKTAYDFTLCTQIGHFGIACARTFFFLRSKKASQAVVKRFQSSSEYFLGIAPMLFHSFCMATNSSVALRQSELSCRASARAYKFLLVS